MGNNVLINSYWLLITGWKKKKIIVMIFCFGFFAISCDAPKGKTKADVMNERLTRKVKGWKAIYLKKCEVDILDAAAAIVDSTLIVNARNSRRKNRPPKPRKPGQPIVEIPVDTTPIAPLIDLLLLFGDTAFVDSLLMLEVDSLRLDSLLRDSMLRSDYEFYFPDTLNNDE